MRSVVCVKMSVTLPKLCSCRRVKLPASNRSRGFCMKVQSHDLIGPVDPKSNLPHIKYAIRENETSLERKLREGREELQNFNHLFWSRHNKCFTERKQEFESRLLKGKKSDDQVVTADEISVFYKQFLDDNWKSHMNYLVTWYRKNISVTFTHLQVLLYNLAKRARSKS